MINAKQIGSPRARRVHQLIITGTTYNMWSETRNRGWQVMAEATVTDNPNDNYPDIIILDDRKQLLFCLEITRTWSSSYDRRKCEGLQKRFPQTEFFVYNYETDVLSQLDKDGKWYSSVEYELFSRLFSRPLVEYIYIPEDY